MIGAPTPPPGQFGITSVGGGYQMPPQRGGGISPGGYPAMPQRGGMPQPPAFAPPVPAMGQRPGIPGQIPGVPGMTPGGFPAQQNALNSPVQPPQGGGWAMQAPKEGRLPLDINAILEWARSHPSAQSFRTDDGFDRAGWQAARDEWMGSAPWRGLVAPGGGGGGQLPPQAPFARPQPPQGMVGQSYDVQNLIPSGSPYQFPTYNFGG